MTQELFNKFFNKYNGKFVDAEDPANLNQCMDLAFKWCDALEIPRGAIRHVLAYQVFKNPSTQTFKYFELIKNGPFNSPRLGDLVVIGTSVGKAGHISIATGKGNLFTYESFDQNWGEPKTCRLVTHPYNLLPNGTLGWLRPKDEDEKKLDQIQAILNANLDSSTKLRDIKAVL